MIDSILNSLGTLLFSYVLYFIYTYFDKFLGSGKK